MNSYEGHITYVYISYLYNGNICVYIRLLYGLLCVGDVKRCSKGFLADFGPHGIVRGAAAAELCLATASGATGGGAERCATAEEPQLTKAHGLCTFVCDIS